MLASRCRRRDVLIGQRRADEHVRRRDAVCEKKMPLVLLAGKEYGSGLGRLGGQGAEAAGRARGDSGKFRADPSLEPGRHGDLAAAI